MCVCVCVCVERGGYWGACVNVCVCVCVSSCLATEVLIVKYLPTRREVASGAVTMDPDCYMTLIGVHSTMHLIDRAPINVR